MRLLVVALLVLFISCSKPSPVEQSTLPTPAPSPSPVQAEQPKVSSEEEKLKLDAAVKAEVERQLAEQRRAEVERQARIAREEQAAAIKAIERAEQLKEQRRIAEERAAKEELDRLNSLLTREERDMLDAIRAGLAVQGLDVIKSKKQYDFVFWGSGWKLLEPDLLKAAAEKPGWLSDTKQRLALAPAEVIAVARSSIGFDPIKIRQCTDYVTQPGPIEDWKLEVLRKAPVFREKLTERLRTSEQ